MKIRSPRTALDHKIAFASENRKAEGLIADLSVRANIVLAMQAEKGWLRQIPAKTQDELADKYIKALEYAASGHPDKPTYFRGNQQEEVCWPAGCCSKPMLVGSTNQPQHRR